VIFKICVIIYVADELHKEGDEVNKYEEIKQRQLQKGVKKYGDNDICSRRNFEEIKEDILEELMDAIVYTQALLKQADIAKTTEILVDLHSIFFRVERVKNENGF